MHKCGRQPGRRGHRPRGSSAAANARSRIRFGKVDGKVAALGQSVAQQLKLIHGLTNTVGAVKQGLVAARRATDARVTNLQRQLYAFGPRSATLEVVEVAAPDQAAAKQLELPNNVNGIVSGRSQAKSAASSRQFINETIKQQEAFVAVGHQDQSRRSEVCC